MAAAMTAGGDVGLACLYAPVYRRAGRGGRHGCFDEAGAVTTSLRTGPQDGPGRAGQSALFPLHRYRRPPRWPL